MKKTILALLLIGTAALGFAQKAVIKDLTGTVELKLAGASDFIPATAGAEVAQDTIISTGFKSTALVQAGSAVITVRPLTRLAFTEIQAMQGAENLNMNLQAGRVRVDVNPPAGTKASLSVSSPTATASVRGTSFEFDTMNLRVNSGTVVFMGKWGYQVSVKEGFTSSVGASGTASAPQVAAGSGLAPLSPAGYDRPTTGTTGGTGVISTPPSTPPTTPPPVTPPVTPPTTRPPSGGGGGGGGNGGNNNNNNNNNNSGNDGGFGVNVDY
jgi:hypothetical protein